MKAKETIRTSILEAIRNIDSNPAIARDILFDLFYDSEKVDYQSIIDDLKSPSYQSMIANLVGRAYYKNSEDDSLLESVIHEVESDVLLTSHVSKAVAFALVFTLIGNSNKQEFFNKIMND